jgi:hypothetical protein
LIKRITLKMCVITNISLLSDLSKALEHIIHKYIFNFYKNLIFFCPFQSDFIPKDSIVNQFTSMYYSFCEARKTELYFAIHPKRLASWSLYKLRISDISDQLLMWLYDYPSDRNQSVVLSCVYCDTVEISARVSQESILWPLLFVININDIISIYYLRFDYFAMILHFILLLITLSMLLFN